jgi:hypothetical protein
MQRIVVVVSLVVLAAGFSANLAQAAPKQPLARAPRVKAAPKQRIARGRAAAPAQQLANFGLANNGLGFGNPGFGFANNGFGVANSGIAFGYPAYGFGYPVYAVPVYGGGFANQGYNYTADPFGGSPNGGNYDYWLTQQAAHGNISWAEANHRMSGQ